MREMYIHLHKFYLCLNTQFINHLQKALRGIFPSNVLRETLNNLHKCQIGQGRNGFKCAEITCMELYGGF